MSSMDLTESIQPRSDQINADDLIAGPMTVTVREVVKGAAEQPFDFMLVETDRAYRPSKTMRRVIVNAWGPDATTYTGRRLTLYREPSIMFGGVKVGGIRISHMSHTTGSVELMAQTTRGKREKFTIQPLAESRVNVGGLQISSEDDAARVIRAMTNDDIKKLRTLLGSDATTKTALASALYEKRATRHAESIHRELQEMDA